MVAATAPATDYPAYREPGDRPREYLLDVSAAAIATPRPGSAPPTWPLIEAPALVEDVCADYLRAVDQLRAAEADLAADRDQHRDTTSLLEAAQRETVRLQALLGRARRRRDRHAGDRRADHRSGPMTPVEIREHIELSRRASAGMTAELAAPHVALADLCLAWFAALDAADGRELTEEALASERGRTEVAERQLRAALGLKHPADLAKGRCELGFEGRITRSRGCPTKHIRSAFEAGFAIGLERGHDTAQVQAEVTEGTIQEDLFVRDRALDEHMAGIKEADVLTDTVTLTFDRAALDAHLASIERTWSRVGRVGQAHRCAIARDPAHPHSAGEAAALMLGLPSPYPDRAAGDRSLTIGGGQ